MKVVSWNTEGRLSRVAAVGERGSPEHIVKEIEQLDGDIVFLPEAFDGALSIEPEIEQCLRELGYESFSVAYNDQGEKRYPVSKSPHMMLLSRFDILQAYELVQVGGVRSMLTADILDPATNTPIRILGIHLDDRGEESRLRQADDLLLAIAARSGVATIALGDFNAMRAESLSARILRSTFTRAVIDRWPNGETEHTLQRMSQMAVGETMRRFEEGANLRHTDEKMQPTITPKARGHERRPSVRLMQIDYILATPDLTPSNFQVAHDGGSDHRAITVLLETTGQNS